jgi:hypothetical protein
MDYKKANKRQRLVFFKKQQMLTKMKIGGVI